MPYYKRYLTLLFKIPFNYRSKAEFKVSLNYRRKAGHQWAKMRSPIGEFLVTSSPFSSPKLHLLFTVCASETITSRFAFILVHKVR